jgi:hypothetical protein
MDRKKRNKEIERKKRLKRNVFTSIFTFMIIVGVCALGFVLWDMHERRTIMVFEGESIATGDFRFFLHGEGEEARDEAMEVLTQTLVLLNRAQKHGITLTDEEMAEHIERSETINEDIGFISHERIAEFMAAWNEKSEQLMDIYVEKVEFELDEDEFAEFLEEQMEHIISGSTNRQLKYVAAHDMTVIFQAMADYTEDGAEIEFDEIIRQYSVKYVEGEEIETIEFIDFLMQYGVWEGMDDIANLEVGEISTMLTGTDITDEEIFFMVQMIERTVDDERIEEEKVNTRENYIARHESEIFQARAEEFFELIEEWASEANREINYRAFKRF